jgi:DNA repair protein SbcD/Mre11
MIRILHTADQHLGMKFASYPEVQVKLSEARFSALEKLIRLANEQMCNLLVLSGDLFDRVSVAKKDVLRTASMFREFSGNLVAILPGNHDFIGGQSDLWVTFRSNMASNILLLDRGTRYPLSHYDVDACLWTGPCVAKHSSQSVVGWMKGLEKDVESGWDIGVAHGSLEGVSPDFNEQYYPMRAAELRNYPPDLWLLGHTHVQYPLTPGEKTTVFIAGTPEPDGFDCRHEGKAWVIELHDDKKIKAFSVSTGSYKFSEEEADVGVGVDKLLERYAGTNHKTHLMKLQLNGRLPGSEYVRLGDLQRLLKEMFFYVEVDTAGVAEEITQDILDQEFSTGSFPHSLLSELLCSNDQEGLQIAYDLIKEVRK